MSATHALVAASDGVVQQLRVQLDETARALDEMKLAVRSNQAVASAALRRLQERSKPMVDAKTGMLEMLALLEVRINRQRARMSEDAAVVRGGRNLVETTIDALRDTIQDLASLSRGSGRPPSSSAASALQQAELVQGKAQAAVHELVKRPTDACAFYSVDACRTIVTRLQQESGLLRLEVAASGADAPTRQAAPSAAAGRDALVLAERDVEEARGGAIEAQQKLMELLKTRARSEKMRSVYSDQQKAMRAQLESKLGSAANQTARCAADREIHDLHELYGVAERNAHARREATLRETRFVTASKWRNKLAEEKSRATGVLQGELDAGSAMEQLFKDGGAALLDSAEHSENERTLREYSDAIARSRELQSSLATHYADMRAERVALARSLDAARAVRSAPLQQRIATRAEVIALAASRGALAAMCARVEALRTMDKRAMRRPAGAKVHIDRYGSVTINGKAAGRVAGAGANAVTLSDTAPSTPGSASAASGTGADTNIGSAETVVARGQAVLSPPTRAGGEAPRWRPISLTPSGAASGAASGAPPPSSMTRSTPVAIAPIVMPAMRGDVPPPPPPRVRVNRHGSITIHQPEPQAQLTVLSPRLEPEEKLAAPTIPAVRNPYERAPSPKRNGPTPLSEARDPYDDLLATLDEFTATL